MGLSRRGFHCPWRISSVERLVILMTFATPLKGISDLKPNQAVIVGVSRESQCGVTTVPHLSRNGAPPRSEGSSSFEDNHHRETCKRMQRLEMMSAR